MATLNSILNQPYITGALDTFSYTVPAGAAGLYNVHVESIEVPASGISIVVNVGGSPLFTAPTLSPTQGSIQFKTSLLLAAADVVTVVLSSAVASDALANNVKTTCTIAQGAN